MLHRFLLVSSKDSVTPVKNANPKVSILPPGDGGWVNIDAGKIAELGNGWYRADLGDWTHQPQQQVNRVDRLIH